MTVGVDSGVCVAGITREWNNTHTPKVSTAQHPQTPYGKKPEGGGVLLAKVFANKVSVTLGIGPFCPANT